MNIAIFASGAGSNADAILKALPRLLFYSKLTANVTLIVTNNPKAGVLQVAASHGVASSIINLKNKDEAECADTYLAILKQHDIGLIVLAGFLKKIPAAVIAKYPQKIINIHPALLPKYGGAGMHGIHVHKAVIAGADPYTGITIHYVDEQYDSGKIIFKAQLDVQPNDTAETLAQKVLQLEHIWYSAVIVKVIKEQLIES